MKVAFCGKGGVGKTTVAAVFSRSLAAAGWKVVAVDADPVPNLAAALGLPQGLSPAPVEIARMVESILRGASPP